MTVVTMIRLVVVVMMMRWWLTVVMRVPTMMLVGTDAARARVAAAGEARTVCQQRFDAREVLCAQPWRGAGHP
jgi:hypothetical protein